MIGLIQRLLLLTVSSVFLPVSFLITLPLAFIMPKLAKKNAWLYCKTMIVFSKLLCGVGYNIKGKENLQKGKKYLVLAKHSSAWETFFLYCLLDCPAAVFKKELFKVPFFGWYLHFLEMISVDRDAGIKSIKKIKKQATERLKKMSILIFPQGTRIKYDKEYSLEKYPYKRGFLPLIDSTDNDIIAISLNTSKYWGKSIISKKTKGSIDVVIQKIEKQDKNKKQIFDEVIQAIETTSADLFDHKLKN